MLRPQLIPCLLIHKGGLVNTIRFGDPKYVGDPINAVRIFNDLKADELVFLDINVMKFFLNSNTSSYLKNLESEFEDSSNGIRIELNKFETVGLLISESKGNRMGLSLFWPLMVVSYTNSPSVSFKIIFSKCQ